MPLARGYEIFRDAYQAVSGLSRTVRGPSMSATPGKVCVHGVAEAVFAPRFPWEPAPYEVVPDELPGLWPIEPDEPGELMVPAI